NVAPGFLLVAYLGVCMQTAPGTESGEWQTSLPDRNIIESPKLFHLGELYLASDAIRSPFINGTLVSKEIYTPQKRGGELAQIYERSLQWRDAGSYYLTFEQRIREIQMVGNNIDIVIPFGEELLTVENPALMHKDLPFREQMKTQFVCRRLSEVLAPPYGLISDNMPAWTERPPPATQGINLNNAASFRWSGPPDDPNQT
ncbi:unnamed protein product, partial [Tetraodon nigroviridis]